MKGLASVGQDAQGRLAFITTNVGPPKSNLFRTIFLERRFQAIVSRDVSGESGLRTIRSQTPGKGESWLAQGCGGGAGGRGRTWLTTTPIQSILGVSPTQAPVRQLHRSPASTYPWVPHGRHRAGCWDPMVNKTRCGSCSQRVYHLWEESESSGCSLQVGQLRGGAPL